MIISLIVLIVVVVWQDSKISQLKRELAQYKKSINNEKIIQVNFEKKKKQNQ